MITCIVPKDYVVQPLKDGEPAVCRATCGTCMLSWDDGVSTSVTPTPSARCPFEHFHAEIKSESKGLRGPVFYTKRGLLTRYAFRCGYVERKGELSLHMEHGVYHVRGWAGNVGIFGGFTHSKEARKCMTHPLTHVASRDGSIVRTTRDGSIRGNVAS